MRKQYHLRDSDRGVLAWDVDRLIRLSAGLPCREVPLTQIVEWDQAYWERSPLTVRELAEHVRLVREADLAFPIILSADGRVMDGMHRVVKAFLIGRRTIHAVQFAEPVEPDFVGVDEADLPYDRPTDQTLQWTGPAERSE